MKSMYHDSDNIKSSGISFRATAKMLVILDLYALRAVALAMAADMSSHDPFSAQAENACICARHVAAACSALDVFEHAEADELDLFTETESLRVPDWTDWCRDREECDRHYARFAVLSDELARLAPHLRRAGMEDLCVHVMNASDYASEVAL